MRKIVIASTASCLLPFVSCLSSGCQQQMAVQPSYRPDESSSFFPDGRGDRPLLPGTVARGHLRTDVHLFAGKSSQQRDSDWTLPAAIIGSGGPNPFVTLALAATESAGYVDTFPFTVTRAVLKRGQERYMIYCVVCHDPLGTGRGKIVERGYTPPPSYHIDRLRLAPVGYLFDVVTNGYGSMPDYKQQIPPRERWAIVAYLRALQLSQHFPAGELTQEMRDEWEKKSKFATAGGQPP